MNLQHANGERARRDNFPGHMLLLEPYPVAGECDWLGGCHNQSADGPCGVHRARLDELKREARSSWAAMGIDLATVVLP